MQKLDSRHAKILQILLSREKPISAAELGAQLSLSPRSVRYSLPVLQGWLAARNVRLQVQPRSGISIIAPPSVRKKLQVDLEREHISLLFKPEERLTLLIFDLLFTEEPLTNAELEALLAVSHTTLDRDLENAERRLAEQHLYLRRKAHQGWTVVGREDDFRHALVSMILNICSEMALIDLVQWGKKPQSAGSSNPYTLETLIVERISGQEIASARRYVNQIETELKTHLADHDNLYLVLYLMVAVRRCRAGHVLDFLAEKRDYIQSLPEFRVAQAVGERIARENGLVVPEEEVLQLALEISTFRNAHHWEIGLSQPLSAGLGPKVSQEMAEELVSEVGTRIQREPVHRDAIVRLKDHLNRTVIRLLTGIPVSNPLAGQVQANYQTLWNAVQDVFGRLDQELGIALPPQEIAYLTMYTALIFEFHPNQPARRSPRVVVACPSGGVTAWMLVSRLHSELPELEIVDTVSLREIGRINAEQVDAIISTTVFTARTVPVITVSPFVNEQEVNRIRSMLGLTG